MYNLSNYFRGCDKNPTIVLDVVSLVISLINIEPLHITYMDSHNTALLGSDLTT